MAIFRLTADPSVSLAQMFIIKQHYSFTITHSTWHDILHIVVNGNGVSITAGCNIEPWDGHIGLITGPRYIINESRCVP